MDCFAPLAMTAQRLIVCGCLKLGSRHCEERSDEAIYSFFARLDGLLRFARNDGSTPGLSVALKLGSRHCEERSDEAIHAFFARQDGLLRFARNDGSTPGLSVAV
jgi:hypothetical protein